MSTEHKPVLLTVGELSGEVVACRVAADGQTITKKWPIGNWEQFIKNYDAGVRADQSRQDAAEATRWPEMTLDEDWAASMAEFHDAGYEEASVDEWARMFWEAGRARGIARAAASIRGGELS